MQLSKEFLDGLATEIPKMVEAFSNPTTEQTESRKNGIMIMRSIFCMVKPLVGLKDIS